ncbi:hypothetical protein PPTG_16445 [Phytophthora nicotianae INRA-310]|uniref:FYVE-type domain-containing protein n=1 Tax=Phytophthora nicotianae (strain INRA-310) TaxID=761204 RepID=W2PNC7_PHYN3|nr:hypothetical protein PPTG_16445 [Phytophthora nicotianae INRA-310]ETN02493.1 hypothetical protein PPTG_16445 [Phytophthora nicotianae INRA-310]
MTQGDARVCPFEQLSLSSADTNQLQLVLKAILEANLGRYQDFLASDKGKANPSTWKLVKTTHRTRVYLERQHRPSFTPFQAHSSTASNDPVLQPFLCVGSTSGNIDDVMLGIVNPPPACVNDLSKATLLSTITLPTTANPFQSVEMKWMELSVRSRLVKNHDYVYVEVTGTRHLPSGERVGYHLLHSVDVPVARRLPDCVRAQLSVCSFFRQESKTSVAVYTLGMMDTLDDRARRVIQPHFVNILLSTFKRAPSVDKKILEKRDSEVGTGASLSRGNCVTCSKRPWRLGSAATCNVCSGFVCNSCKVVKELSFMTPELDMTKRRVIFCSSCAIDENVSEFSAAETSSCTSSWGTAHDSDLRSVLSFS